jgi:hypothetical protein
MFRNLKYIGVNELKQLIYSGFILLFLLFNSKAIQAQCDIDGTVIDISSLPYSETGLSTCGAGNNLNSETVIPCGSGNYLGHEEIVFVFTAPSNDYYHFSISNATQSHASMKLYNGCPLLDQGGSCVAQIANGDLDKILGVDLEQGQTYYLVISRFYDECFEFDLSIDLPRACPEPGTNGWETISLPFVQTGLTNCGMGNDLNYYNTTNCGSNVYLNHEELVYIFEAPISDYYHFSISNATQSHASMKLYDGCPLLDQAGSCVAQIANGDFDKILGVDLEQGQTYYLVISRFYDECFEFDLRIDLPQTCPEPGTNGWETISLPFAQTGLTNCGMGNDLNYYNTTNCGSNVYLNHEELVYIFEAPASDYYHFSLSHATQSHASMKLYDGCPLLDQGGACVAQIANGDFDKILGVDLEQGKTYYLVISRFYEECFEFDLSIDIPQTCPEPGTNGWETISLPFAQNGLTNCGMGNDLNYYNTTNCGSNAYLNHEELVYIFEAPTSDYYHFSLSHATQSHASMKLYDGCPLRDQGGSCVAQIANGDLDKILGVDLEQGKTYYLVISRFYEECFEFDLSIDIPQTCPEPGTNGWETISLPFAQNGLTNCGMGNDLNYYNTTNCGSNVYLNHEELVYIFEAPTSDYYHFSLSNATQSHASLKLFDGCPLLDQGGACVAQIANGDLDKILGADLEQGKTYYLVISRYYEECFEFSLEINRQCLTPVPVVEQPDPLCEDSPMPELTVSNPEGTVSWYADANLTQLLAVGVSYTPNTDTTATYYVTNTLECESGPTTVVVEILSLLAIEAQGISGADNLVCEGESFSLFVNEGTSWLWSTGETTSSIIVIATQSGTWTVETEYLGCTITSDIDITVLENTAPDPVTGMTPADNTENVSLTPTLSWIPGSNSTSFDVYVWKTVDGERPEIPLYEALQSAQISLKKNETEHATDYNWQIVSRNGECGITEGPVQAFSTQDLPNLIVSDIEIQTDGYTGQPFSVTFQVVNSGNIGTGSDGWSDALFLSLDDSLDLKADILLGMWDNEKFLLPGESYTQTVEVTVPKQYLGELYFIVAANYSCRVTFLGIEESNFLNICNNLLTETTVDDNWRVTESSISFVWPPLPDLNPTDFATPQLAFAGDTINIGYTVENIGQAIANSTSMRLVRNMCADLMGGSPGDPSVDKSVAIVVGNMTINCLLSEPYWHDMIFLSSSPVHDPENDILLAIETVSFRKENFIANGNTIPEPFDQVALSERNEILDEWENTPGYLNEGDNYQKNMQVVLPHCIDGEYYLHLISDYSGWVWEFNHANNIISKTLQVITTPPPDLVVSDGTVSENPFSGELVYLDYEINNIGAGKPAGGFWTDQIYLLPTSEFDEQTAILVKSKGVLNGDTLEPDQSMDVSTSFRIPNGLSGQYYVFIHANASESVCEFDLENNYFTIPLDIELSPSPDLLVNNLSITGEPIAESNINLSYTTLNQGDGTAIGPWLDEVYLSQSPDFYPDISRLFFRYNHSDTLQSDQSKTTDVEVRIPSVKEGEWYIYVRTNIEETVYEHEATDNNVFRSGPWQIQERLVSDLEANDLTIAETIDAGQLLPFSYKVTNMGLAPPNAFSWNELIYLSDNPTLSEDTVRLMKRVYTGEDLNPGAFLERTGSVQIPNGVSGTKYIHVVVDGNNAIENDTNKENNFIAAAISVIQPPTPDLQLVSVELPDLFYAGEPVWITYTAVNQGPATTQTQWADRMGASLNWDGMPHGRSYKKQNLQIAQGEQYTDSIMLTLPGHFSGTYFFSVTLDALDEIYEHEGEDNNTSLYPITVLQPEPVDLIVSDIISPASAIPGRMTSYSFTVTNQGINPVKSNYIANLYLEGNDFPGLGNSLLWASERPSLTLLEPGNSISFLVERPFPGLKDGLVNTRVLANASLSLLETDYSNNELMGDDPISSTLPVLPVNTEITDTLAMGSSLFYKINLPDNADLRVKVTSDFGYAENSVFLRNDNVPSGPIYDARSLSGNTASPVLLVPGTTEGDNYLKIENFNPSFIPTQDLTIRADVLPFGIDSINPSVMGQGRVTSQVFGAGFRAGAVVELLNQSNTPVFSGQILRFISSMQLEIRWQLENTPEGIYHLRITNPGGESVLLSNAVRVEPAKEFDVALIPVYESIIGDRNPATVGLIFRNNSNVDAPVVKAGIYYNNAHELVNITKQEKVFTRSEILSGLSDLPMDSFPDVCKYPDEQDNKDMILLYVHDIAPGQSRETSLTFRNFPYAVFSVGVSMEVLTKESYLNLIAYGAIMIRNHIINGYDFAGDLGLTPAQTTELYDVLDNESAYLHAMFQQYMHAGLILQEDTIGFIFDPTGLDIPEDYSNTILNQKSSEFNGYKGSSWNYDVKNNLLPVPLPGPGGPGGSDPGPDPDPDPPGPWSCESIGGQAAVAWCRIQTEISCVGSGVCLIAGGITLIGVKSGILTVPSLAVMAEGYLLCKGMLVGCFLSKTVGAPSSPDDIFCMEVQKSCDPNEIQGPTGIGDQQFIAKTDRVNYTVYFENDPELASAAAKQVRIAVPISEFANPLSTRLSSFGFADNAFEVPVNSASINQRIDLREKEGYFLDVIGGLDIQRNEFFWLLTTIDPATGQIPVNPSVGFLQINDSTGVGEGFVKFSVTPHESTVTGDTLAHFADIYFDLNPPITTNTHFNTIDAVAPTTVVDELPRFSEEGNLQLNLSATDDEGGSGLGEVEVYMSRNDEEPVLIGKERKFEWIIDAQICDSLAFFVRSIDKVGNTEPMPDQPQTYTILGRSNVSAGDDVTLCAGNEVTLTASAGESYLWSNGETSQSITVVPDSTSVYSVVVTNSDGCAGEATVTVTLQDCTIVDENDQSGSSLKVYPNPVPGDEIFAEISNLKPGTYQLSLFDQNGKNLFAAKLQLDQLRFTQRIPLQGFPKGTYILEITGKEHREVKVFVIAGM